MCHYYCRTKAEFCRGLNERKIHPEVPLTLTNFLESVAKILPRIDALMYAVDVYNALADWKTPSETLCAIVLLYVACANPIIIFAAPQIVVLALIFTYWLKRHILLTQGEPLPTLEGNEKPNLSMMNPNVSKEIHVLLKILCYLSDLYDSSYLQLKYLETASYEEWRSLVVKMVQQMIFVGIVYEYLKWNWILFLLGLNCMTKRTMVYKLTLQKFSYHYHCYMALLSQAPSLT
jgi:hypothetical protein